MGFPNYQTLTNEPSGPGAAFRSIPDRIADYELLKYLGHESTVLDIGCNRGFFGVALTDHVKHYLGLDSDPNQLVIGQREIAARHLANIELITASFEDWSGHPVDAIFLFAVHAYIKMEMADLATKVVDLLTPWGCIFLEGHPNGYMGEPAKLLELQGALAMDAKKVLEKTVKDRGLSRSFTVWQRIRRTSSSCCSRLPDGHVKKVYDAPNHWVPSIHFWKSEVEALEKLLGKPHFPQIVGSNEQNLEIVMTYCGEPVTRETLPENWIEQCLAIKATLDEAGLFHNDSFCKNICVLDGTIYLIDFGICTTNNRVRNLYHTCDLISSIRKELFSPPTCR